jgi:preprotein translocase subunit SecF
MEFFKVNTQIDFMGKRGLMAAVLIVLIAISLGSLLIQGLNLGLDFSGGTLIEASYDAPVDLKKVRGILGQGRVS